MSTVTLTMRRRDLAWGVALLVLLSAIWVARSDVADAGGSPPGTGIAVVYVAVGTNFPDSLGVGPGAGVNGAPIIIVPTNPPIPAASQTELLRLDPRTVIIVGGTAVISAGIETALGALLPNAVVSRIAGANRYETNAAFSAATFPIEGWASIPAAAFTTQNPDTDDATIATNAAWNATGGALLAPIQLPHGAEILELKINAYDNNGVTNMRVALVRLGVLSGTAEVAHVNTSLQPGDTTVATMLIATGQEIVDNENYAYLVVVSDTTTTDPRIRSVMVRYRLGASTG
jgi:hypothetical protein